MVSFEIWIWNIHASKTLDRIILEALFADDCALMAHKESDLQLIVDRFVEASCLFGPTISLGKTEVLLQTAHGFTVLSPSISIEGTTLKSVEEFKYCGSIISGDGSLVKEICARICKANQTPWMPAYMCTESVNKARSVQGCCSHEPLVWMWEMSYRKHL